MENAWSVLEDLGAVYRGKLTALGRHMASLHLDLRLGKVRFCADQTRSDFDGPQDAVAWHNIPVSRSYSYNRSLLVDEAFIRQRLR
jgi:HrpA-like RNA helicase